MVNDTVGTMMSCGYRDQSCEIGMIIGNYISDLNMKYDRMYNLYHRIRPHYHQYF